MYTLNAPESKRQYPRPLRMFLDFLRIDCLTVEEKSNKLFELITKNGREWLENQLIKFFATQRAQVDEISTETIAYDAIKEWMDFRSSFGEQITAESWIIRDLWQIKSQRFGNYLGLAKNPKQLSSAGIRMLINDAWKIQGVREARQDGKKRYEFKSLHGFRKFFETEMSISNEIY